MTKPLAFRNSLEILEQRIAPAALLNEAGFKTGLSGTALLLNAGEGLSTGGPKSGSYLLYVEKGTALVFTTDLNNNDVIDSNEITGIAAGNGLRLISFVDIHGDIVTNLKPDTSLSDSDNNASNNDPNLRGDGRVLLNSRIEKIELRSLAITDIDDQNGDGVIDDQDVTARLALSSYSIHGNILAGGGFGVPGDPTSGLIIDTTNKAVQQAAYPGLIQTIDLFIDFKPTIGSIKAGTAASGTFFSFGASNKEGDIQGYITTFVPAVGQAGSDIANVKSRVGNSATAFPAFNIDSLEAGDGGIGARGGHISDVRLSNDSTGGYRIISGDGGRGINGGAGGNISGFSDVGSITGEVLIKTGDGGAASTGIGGNGGTLQLGIFDINADVTILLGNGGTGFTAGGTGAPFASATVTVPDPQVSFGLNVTANGRDHLIGADQIGTKVPVDFNENLAGDFVFSSTHADQLVVMLDGAFQRIPLDGPVSVGSIVVGDFNGDGHTDIAAASKADGAFGGIFVWLNQFEDLNGDGILSDTEDLNNNGIDDFVGFSGPIHSAMPYLTGAVGTDPDDGTGALFGFFRSASAVGDLTTGDFNGDGYTDIAVALTHWVFANGGNQPRQVLYFLTPNLEKVPGLVDDPGTAEREDIRPTGQFYADFGTKGNPFAPYVFAGGGAPGNLRIEASAIDINDGKDYDAVFTGVVNGAPPNPAVGDGGGVIRAWELPTPSPTGATLLGVWALGRVDVDRALPGGGDQRLSLQAARMQDFALLDVRGPVGGSAAPDGKADLVVITSQPSPDFVILIAGDGLGGPAAGSRLSDVSGDLQNAGIALGAGSVPPNVTANIGSPFVSIRATDRDGINGYNDVAVLNYDTSPISISIHEFGFVPRTTTSINGNTAITAFAGGRVDDDTIIAWDNFTPNLSAPGIVAYIAANATQDPLQFNGLLGFGGGPSVVYVNNGFDIQAGDGGDALVGRGGTGGSLGSGLTNVGGLAFASLDFTLVASFTTPLTVSYTAGNGGNGFSTGGNGGSVSGLEVRTPNGLGFATVSLVAGNGGFGVSGAGGRGGDLKANSVQDGNFFTAGNGGRGLTGGAGGSVIGNGFANYFDAQVGTLVIQSGIGGSGVKGGGAGGNISGFTPTYNIGGLGASTLFFAGDGGTAISGTGGSGGSIVNIVPFTEVNLLQSEIYFEAGNGGSGRSGGAGGSIRNFRNSPSTADNPVVLSFLAGHGGSGTQGNGGAGGNIADIVTPSVGTNSLLPFSQTDFVFNRLLAGNGGDSSGAAGGAGGRISGLNVSASEGSFAIAAGEGGTGLTAGGAGGSVTDSSAAVGGSSPSKLLVIAGKGGDVNGLVPNANDSALNQDKKSFGGKVGVAGNGGNITSFRQDLGIATRVDLIAGNGGDTLNYGTITPGEKSFVGRGGSVTKIRVVGSLGTIDPTVPLKSYNDTSDANGDGRVDQTVAEFVEENLRLTSPGALGDNLGNVGVIVGTAGRLKTIQVGTTGGGVSLYDSQPASNIPNGSLTDVTARNLVAAVAGSIDRIAAISVVSNLRIGFQGPGAFSPGVVGADKDVIGDFEYFDRAGSPSVVPVLDGFLGDGAIVAKVFGAPTLIGRVFTL